MTHQLTPTTELNLGDVVRLTGDDGYNDCTVKQIEEHHVVLFRPYVATADFSYTGGVICTIGIEEVRMSRSETTTVRLLRRGRPLR